MGRHRSGSSPGASSLRRPDLEQIRSLVAQIAALLGMDVRGDGADDMLPATWFKRQTLVSASQLRGARLRKVIRCERRGGRWYYSKSEARRLFPDRWLDAPASLPDRSD